LLEANEFRGSMRSQLPEGAAGARLGIARSCASESAHPVSSHLAQRQAKLLIYAPNYGKRVSDHVVIRHINKPVVEFGMRIAKANQAAEPVSEYLRFVGHYFFVVSRFAVQTAQNLGKLTGGVEHFQRVAMSLYDKRVWKDGEKFLETVRVVG
jgi:hypothetical protein